MASAVKTAGMASRAVKEPTMFGDAYLNSFASGDKDRKPISMAASDAGPSPRLGESVVISVEPTHHARFTPDVTGAVLAPL